MYRDVFRLRLLFCLNFVLFVILASVAQAQAQPGAGAENSSNPTSKTSAAAADQRVILKVGNQQITQAAFEQYISDLESQQGPASLSWKKLGDNYASMLALSEQAKADQLENSPEVQRQLAIDRVQILSNAEFAKLKKEAAPTPEEIKAYYNAHAEDFEIVLVKRIFIWSTGSGSKGHGLTPDKAKAMADEIRQAYKSGGDVDKIVRDTPHGPEDVVADEQPLKFRRGEMPAVMNKAVFDLKQGEWTEFNNGPAEYVFVKVIQRTHEDLDDATPEITKKVLGENMRQKLSAIKSKTGVWMDETYFASKTPAPANTPPEGSGQAKSTEREEKE